MPRLVRLLIAALGLALVADARAAVAPGFTQTAYVTGLDTPTAIAFLPDHRLLVAEKGGFSGSGNAALKLFDAGTVTTLGTIPVCAAGEMGLLGIAIDPSFLTNGFIYLYRTEPDGGCNVAADRSNEVVRVTMTGTSIDSPTVLLTGIRTDEEHHDGGGMRIGPDGKLYVSVGDTGVGDPLVCPGLATNPYAEDLNALEGKVLRLELDGSVPEDNPYVGQAGKRGEIFASGFRNPFRFGFDPVTGALWLGDVGDVTIEEIDIVTVGADYAWPHCEGTLPSACEHPGDKDPIFEYWHGYSDLDTGCGGEGLPELGGTVIGGAFAPATFGGRGGHYFFADFNISNIYDAVVNDTRDGIVGTPSAFVNYAGGPVDLIFGPDGALYYVAINAGQVRRVAPTVDAGDQFLNGKKLVLKTKTGTAIKKSFAVMAKDPGISLGGGPGSGDDPTLHPADLRVVSTEFDDTYTLPQANWRTSRNGYVYKDATRSDGPVRFVAMMAGKAVKVIASGAALGHTLASDPNPVSVVLTTGGTHYCMTFGGTPKFAPDKLFSAVNAPAPGGCPP